MPASGAEDRAVVTTAVVASCLSIVGSLFIIISWLASSSRMFFLRLIMLLSIANLLSSLSYAMSARLLIDDNSSDTICQLQAWTMTIFESASVLWTLVIAWTLHEQVVGKRGDVERLEPLYHALCWGLPLAMAIAMSMSSELGPATPEHTDWCWIAGGAGASRPRADWAQLGVFYIPLVLAFGANVVVYLRVSSAFGALSAEGAVDPSKGQARGSTHASRSRGPRRVPSRPGRMRAQMVQLRLRLYLGVFILVWLPPLVHRTLQAPAPARDRFCRSAISVAARRSPVRVAAARPLDGPVRAAAPPRGALARDGLPQCDGLRVERQGAPAIPRRARRLPTVVRASARRER